MKKKTNGLHLVKKPKIRSCTKLHNMKNIKNTGISFMLAAVILQGCAIIRPGEIGLKQHLGHLKGEPVSSGVKWFNPFSSRIIKEWGISP